MNCPRCKHGAGQVEPGFWCFNCSAGFLADETSASLAPLVHEDAQAGRFEVRRREATDPKVWLGLVFFLGLVALYLHPPLQTGGRRPPGWVLLLLLGCAGLAVRVLVRDRFSTVLIEVRDTGLTIFDGLLGRLRPTHVPRDSIDGLWVKCLVGEDGPLGRFNMMVDQNGSRSRALFGFIGGLGPMVMLAETLAARLKVPSDTRGSEFR